MKGMNNKTPWCPGILVAVAIMGLSASFSRPSIIQQMAFCAPAAHLAGFLSGAPCVKDGDNYRLIGSNLDLTVVPACAATDYFCMLAGFLSLLVTWRSLGLRAQLLVLPTAWIVTVIVNALRLTACWQTDRFAQALLPQSLWPTIHMAVGVVTFLTGMIGVYWAVYRVQGSGGRRLNWRVQ